MTEIDFVVLWVDGNDKEWQKEILKYKKTIDFKRYRDWDILKYQFRGFENYTPWVRKIHFITFGHLPKWLDLNNPKINIVNHKDIIKNENLPTFNSSAIEINIHKIQGLSEKFVLFNDDFFVVKKIKENYFFYNNLPREMGVMNIIASKEQGITHEILNNIITINRNFNKKDVLKKFFLKFFNFKYGVNIFRNIMLMLWPIFPGFLEHHMPTPFLKNTFYKIWEKETILLESTSSSKFRTKDNITQYLFKNWQICEGNFYPRHYIKTKYVSIDNIKEMKNEKENILKKKYEMICLNDNFDGNEDEFIYLKKEIQDMFDKLGLNKVSSFEKY